MGKIKDVTFVYELSQRQTLHQRRPDALADEIGACKQDKFIVIMTSCGYLYYEMLSDVTSAKNGVYYVTSTIEFNPNEPVTTENLPVSPALAQDKDKSSGTQLGGGVSVYYSFKLQLLFWSYLQGKTFIGSFKPNTLVRI